MKNENSQDYAFRNAEFMTAREKTQVLRDWERFIESGFEKRCFTDHLYKHLTLHCSFIAHYDIAGFYDVYFGEKRNTGRFMNQFTSGISSEYGMDYWLRGSYGDVNNAMCQVMLKYSPDLKKRLDGEIETEDIAAAKALLAKHGKRFKIEGDDVF